MRDFFVSALALSASYKYTILCKDTMYTTSKRRFLIPLHTVNHKHDYDYTNDSIMDLLRRTHICGYTCTYRPGLN